VAAQADTVAVIDCVPYLATPHAFLGVAGSFFGNSVAKRGADLLDPHGRKREGNVKRGVDMALEAAYGVSSCKAA